MACQCELLFSVTLEEFHAQLGAAEPLELERREAGDGVVDQRKVHDDVAGRQGDPLDGAVPRALGVHVREDRGVGATLGRGGVDC